MITLILIALFITGIGIGFPLRKNKYFVNASEKFVVLTVFALLFFLGVSVGSDSRIVQNISTLGWQAVALSSGAIMGSLVLARFVASFFRNARDQEITRISGGKGKIRITDILKNQSLWILIFFIAGIVSALYGFIPHFLGNEKIPTATLFVMMISVGAGIGSDPRAVEILRQTSFHILIVPLIIIIGSLGGSLAVSFLLDNVDAANGMAIGAGFGYYSLSAILIGKISGNELGVMALLANIFREIVTLTMAPILVRWFGKLAAIASGGATAMDTTLPVIVKASGKEYAVISIFSGIVLSILVPVLVPLLLGQ